MENPLGYEHLHVDYDFSLLDGFGMMEDNFLRVVYEYLTPKQCEELKKKVTDKLGTYQWGTYDEDGGGLEHYLLENLSSQHLENILITQPQISNEIAAAILLTLKKRWGVL